MTHLASITPSKMFYSTFRTDILQDTRSNSKCDYIN